jgi:hypothetical protein
MDPSNAKRRKEKPMKEAELLRDLARLETQYDHAVTELEYIDQLLKGAGFSQGLITLKAAAAELIRMREQNPSEA